MGNIQRGKEKKRTRGCLGTCRGGCVKRKMRKRKILSRKSEAKSWPLRVGSHCSVYKRVDVYSAKKNRKEEIIRRPALDKTRGAMGGSKRMFHIHDREAPSGAHCLG